MHSKADSLDQTSIRFDTMQCRHGHCRHLNFLLLVHIVLATYACWRPSVPVTNALTAYLRPQIEKDKA